MLIVDILKTDDLEQKSTNACFVLGLRTPF